MEKQILEAIKLAAEKSKEPHINIEIDNVQSYFIIAEFVKKLVDEKLINRNIYLDTVSAGQKLLNEKYNR